MLGKRNGIFTRFVAIGLIAGVWGSGCAEKRDARFAQGDGLNLYQISDFTSRHVDKVLATGKKFNGVTSRADQLIVHEGFEQIRSFNEVNFHIDSPLMDGIDYDQDVKFYGREGSEDKPFTYDIEYKFTDSHIIFYKISAKEDMPSQEMTYAEPRGDGRFAVAMFGLPISLYTVDKLEDSRGKDTRTYKTFGKDYLHEATHFKVKKTGIKYFDAPNKLDLFSADYFNPKDEWYYTRTIVGRPPDDTSTTIGGQVTAIRMRMVKTKNSILGVDVNIPPEQEVLDPQKLNVALEIPVKWVDYQTVTSGSDALLKQVEIGDDDKGSRFWTDRQYGLVDFNNADRLQRTPTQENKLERLEVGDDYIGFLIFESSTGFTWKLSMVKAPEKVEGFRFPFKDRNYFHIFADLKSFINGILYTQKGDYDRQMFANRYYPRNGEIVFNITESTPDVPFAMNAIRKSVEAWDVAFQKAGTGIRVKLDEKRVEMGDVRYNKIAFHGYEINTGGTDGMLLGYGPNIGDSRTGEVYTSTTNIYMRAYREIVMRAIRNFIRNHLGLYDDKAIPGIDVADHAIDNIVAIAKSGNIASRSENLASMTTGGRQGMHFPLALIAPTAAGASATSIHHLELGQLATTYQPAFNSMDQLVEFQANQGYMVDALTGFLSDAEVQALEAGIAKAHQVLKARPDTLSPAVGSMQSDGLDYAGLFSSPAELNSAIEKSMYVEGQPGKLASGVQMADSFKKIIDGKLAGIYGTKATDSHGSCQFGSVGAQVVSFEKIEKRCLGGKTTLTSYLKELDEANKGSNKGVIYGLEAEHSAILECADVMMEEMLLSTLMHELGHNFGLGHNFEGTTDPENFPLAEDGKTVKFRSSTVMEYPNRDFDIFNEVGPYDIAALRYSYGRKVETKDGSLLTIPDGVSIEDAARNSDVQAKKYKVCDDRSAGDSSLQGVYNPMCRRWDAGSNPEEVVDWAITDIMSIFVTDGYSYNDFGAEPSLASAGWLVLKQIYEKFRSEKAVMDTLGPYLEYETNPTAFENNLKNLVKRREAAGDLEFGSYYRATLKIFDFASSVMFYPTMTCMMTAQIQIPTSSAEGAPLGDPLTIDLPLEFARVRRGIYKFNGANVVNCAQAAPYLDKLKDSEAFFAADSGIVLNEIVNLVEVAKQHEDMPYALSTEEFQEGFTTFSPRLYAKGMQYMKDRARYVLFDRLPTLMENAVGANAILPNFMDDAFFRAKFIEKYNAAILSGSDLAQAGYTGNTRKNGYPLFNGGTVDDFQDDGVLNGSFQAIAEREQAFQKKGAATASFAAETGPLFVSQYSEVESLLMAITQSTAQNGDRPGIVDIRNRLRTRTREPSIDPIPFAFNNIWPEAAARPNASMVYGYDLRGLFRYATSAQNFAALYLERYKSIDNGYAVYGESKELKCALFASLPIKEILGDLHAQCGVPANADGVLAKIDEYFMATSAAAENAALRLVAQSIHNNYAERTGMSYLLQGEDIALVVQVLETFKKGFDGTEASLPMATARAHVELNRLLGSTLPRYYQTALSQIAAPFGEMAGASENFSAQNRILAALTEMTGAWESWINARKVETMTLTPK